ncbi:MAG: hypothetical protein IJ083_01050 [Clostridia bacterium]|nr:hypothetical protein [Clostridia bacterium]
MSKRDILVILLTVVVLVAFVFLIRGIDRTHASEETTLVRDAVKNAALTCYAVEGAYPDSLEYLREAYGLAYDENRYFVTYDAFASNHLPEIFVTEGEGED